MNFAFLASENMHVLTIVLRSGEEPRLNRAQLFRVQRANRAYKLYRDAHPDPDDDEGPEDEDAWLPGERRCQAAGCVSKRPSLTNL